MARVREGSYEGWGSARLASGRTYSARLCEVWHAERSQVDQDAVRENERVIVCDRTERRKLRRAGLQPFEHLRRVKHALVHASHVVKVTVLPMFCLQRSVSRTVDRKHKAEAHLPAVGNFGSVRTANQIAALSELLRGQHTEDYNWCGGHSFRVSQRHLEPSGGGHRIALQQLLDAAVSGLSPVRRPERHRRWDFQNLFSQS